MKSRPSGIDWDEGMFLACAVCAREVWDEVVIRKSKGNDMKPAL